MAGRLTLLAQLSDPHVEVGRGDRASALALAAAVRAVTRLRPRPHATLVSGDLVNNAGAREYERVRELLAPLRMPVYVLAGNHDDRDALREYFALQGTEGTTGAAGEPFQYVAEVRGLRMIACDTTLPGREEGALDARRRAWLETSLAADVATPTIVAMHHTPLLTGHHGFDSIALAEPDRLALGELLARASQVYRVVGGHFHRAIFDTLGGRGVIACPSTHLQVPLEIGGEEIRLVAAGPAFMLHVLLESGELVSHLQPVSARGTLAG